MRFHEDVPQALQFVAYVVHQLVGLELPEAFEFFVVLVLAVVLVVSAGRLEPDARRRLVPGDARTDEPVLAAVVRVGDGLPGLGHLDDGDLPRRDRSGMGPVADRPASRPHREHIGPGHPPVQDVHSSDGQSQQYGLPRTPPQGLTEHRSVGTREAVDGEGGEAEQDEGDERRRPPPQDASDPAAPERHVQECRGDEDPGTPRIPERGQADHFDQQSRAQAPLPARGDAMAEHGRELEAERGYRPLIREQHLAQSQPRKVLPRVWAELRYAPLSPPPARLVLHAAQQNLHLLQTVGPVVHRRADLTGDRGVRYLIAMGVRSPPHRLVRRRNLRFGVGRLCVATDTWAPRFQVFPRR
ncbi:hypothetical protein [Streptomyces sp. STR69]|uniref:hypothetical protein n=1 Tax=Streptomyces sp. STR69 TaxID=1796942 RepID=UPI0021CAD1EB